MRNEHSTTHIYPYICPYMCPYICPYMCPYICPYTCPSYCSSPPGAIQKKGERVLVKGQLVSMMIRGEHPKYWFPLLHEQRPVGEIIIEYTPRGRWGGGGGGGGVTGGEITTVCVAVCVGVSTSPLSNTYRIDNRPRRAPSVGKFKSSATNRVTPYPCPGAVPLPGYGECEAPVREYRPPDLCTGCASRTLGLKISFAASEDTDVSRSWS